MKITLEWSVRQLSLNKWYESQHWSKRKATTDDWHKFFSVLLIMQKRSIPKEVKAYAMELRYNSNLDPSNTIAMVKLCEDAMQKMDIIKGDDKRFCVGICLKPDLDMKKKHYELEIEFI
jgi:hypothetical protein